jgi:putative tricarboxylic transport membrane protein
MVPMLSLGLPSSPSTAIMLAALIMFGLKPGPSLFREAPQLVWGLIGSMYIGNVMLVVINIACIPLIVLFMDRIRAYLPLAILLLSAFGVYSYRNSVFDIGIMLLFAVVGYGLRKIEFPQAPVILGVLLGGQAESSLRQAMVLSDGNPAVLVTRPISAMFLCLTLVSIFLPTLVLRKKGKPA